MGDEGPVLFWKEDDPEWGWLCQWYASPFHAKDEKIIYKHAEQYAVTSLASRRPSRSASKKRSSSNHSAHKLLRYMMQHKALQFADHATAAEILLTSSPRKCKALGSRVE